DVFHMDDWAVEEQWISETHHDVVGLAALIELDVHGRQLAESHREVVVGAGKIGAPPRAALLEAIRGEVGAAEVEGAVEVFELRPLGRLAGEAADASAADPDPRAPFGILLGNLR